MVGVFLYEVPDGFFAVAGKNELLLIFMTIVVIEWILVVALFSFFITKRHRRFPENNWWLCVSRYTFHTPVSRGCLRIKKFN